jgi:hypothetical protein
MREEGVSRADGTAGAGVAARGNERSEDRHVTRTERYTSVAKRW